MVADLRVTERAARVLVRGAYRSGWAMHATARRFLFEWYPCIALAGLAGVGVLAACTFKFHLTGGGEVTVGAAGLVAGFVYFVQQQRLAELNILHSLFTRFNERYDALDPVLNHIAGQATQADFTDEERAYLHRYFNLCAEEHFYYRQEAIHHDIWATWLYGMRWYCRNSDRIRRLWFAELQGNAYYGMPVDLLASDDGPALDGEGCTIATCRARMGYAGPTGGSDNPPESQTN